MLNWVGHEKSVITSGLGSQILSPALFFNTLSNNNFKTVLSPNRLFCLSRATDFSNVKVKTYRTITMMAWNFNWLGPKKIADFWKIFLKKVILKKSADDKILNNSQHAKS